MELRSLMRSVLPPDGTGTIETIKTMRRLLLVAFLLLVVRPGAPRSLIYFVKEVSWICHDLSVRLEYTAEGSRADGPLG